MKKTWISLLIVFAFLAVGIGFISIASIAYGGGNFFMFAALGNGPVELVNTLELDIANIDNISFTYSSEDIVFYRGESNHLIVREYLYDNGENIEAKVLIKGGSLEIEQGKRYNNYFFLQINRETPRIEVYLPESYRGSIAAATMSGDISSSVSWEWAECALMASSGDVEMAEIKAGTVSIATTSGAIKTSDITAEEVSLSSSSGDIDTANMKAGEVSMSTSSGEMIIADISADKLDAVSSSGDMKFRSILGSKNISSSSGEISIGNMTGETAIITTSGSITLQIPSSESFTFKAQTTSGDIRTDFDDILSFNKKGNRAEGTYGSGKTYAVDLSASSGDVKVRLIQ